MENKQKENSWNSSQPVSAEFRPQRDEVSSGGAENAGVENAGVEKAGAITYGKPLEQKTLKTPGV